MITPHRFRSHRLVKRASSSVQRGFTLVEIIVVLVILGVLVTILVKNLFGQAEQARVQANVVKMQQVKGYISQYQLMHNDFPRSIQDLSGGNCGGDTTNPCIAIAKEDELKDVWGTPFQYAVDGGGRSFTLKSLGADRREGGSDVNADMTLTGP